MGPTRQTIPPSVTFGRYTVVRHLGTGAMGEVYLATDDTLKRQVALKLLHREHFEREHLRARFRREARAVAAVSHPNVVQIFDIDEYEGRPYFVMEYLGGTDAQDLLDQRGRLETRLAAAIGLGAARGLAEAMATGVVHRDIKPANLFLTDRNVVKVTDFGLAKGLRAINTSAQLTMQGTTLGTPDYMSPEQARGEEVDGRADIYGLGCSLYHMLAGQPPFRGPDEQVNYMEVIGRHVSAPVPALDHLPDVPPQLADLVTRMMAKRRRDRPGYDEIIVTLRAVARGKLTGAEPEQTSATLPPEDETAAEAAEIISRELAPPPPRRRVNWTLYLTVFSLLAFAASLALWIFG